MECGYVNKFINAVCKQTLLCSAIVCSRYLGANKRDGLNLTLLLVQYLLKSDTKTWYDPIFAFYSICSVMCTYNFIKASLLVT